MDVSAAFFRQVVESSRDGIWVFDPSGHTIYVNERAADLLGYPRDEMSRLSVFDVLDEPGRLQLAAHLEHLARVGPTPHDVECTYVRKDGALVRLMIGESALAREDGVVAGYVHRLSEDEDRRALVGELSRSRELLDEAQSIARLGSWELDLATKAMTWSRQLYGLLGLDPETFVPTRSGFGAMVVESDRPKIDERVDRIRREGGDFEVDARVLRTDGAQRWVRLLGRAIVEDGVPVRLAGTMQDITDIKETELQLLDAVVLNLLMQVMASAANEATTLVEALEVTRGQLLAHDDWLRAVGFLVTDGGGLEPFMLRDDQPDRVPTDHERRVAERVLASRETVFEEVEQPQNPSIGFAISLEDTPLAVVVITNREPFERHAMLQSMVAQVSGQLAQVALRESAAGQLAAARDAAMEASRLKSAFLATMSHEIRTPMNGVVGLNELLLRTDLDPHQRRLSQGIQMAGQTLLGLINDILDFSKIEAGELELEVLDFEVRPVLEQVTAIVTASAADKGLELVIAVEDDVPERLVGDPTRLGQVVSNLVSNAVKFTDHGRVEVRARVEETGDEHVVLRVEVADTGIGIGPDQMARLFEPFRQADASTTRTFGGTGLGLAISTQLVHALGGELGASSEPGRGSTFWFTGRFGRAVAMARGGPVRVERREDLPMVEQTGQVLVVEDNEINQLVAIGLLEALGFGSEVAASGEAAVRMAAEGVFCAVLMDVQMPGMDGYEAARLIRAQEPEGRRVPIIAMTASAVVGERERCLAAGMDDFLTKPVSAERLGSVLRAYLAAGAAPSEAAVTGPVRRAEVLDASRLQELADLGERAVGLVVRAVENFVTRVPEVMDELRSAIDGSDAQRLRDVAHQFRGSALNLGANRVAEVTLDLELLGERGVVDAAADLLDEWRGAAEAAAVALQEYRDLRLAG